LGDGASAALQAVSMAANTISNATVSRIKNRRLSPSGVFSATVSLFLLLFFYRKSSSDISASAQQTACLPHLHGSLLQAQTN